MDSAVTPWMRVCDPVHAGWYQMRWPFGEVGMRWWTGSQWRMAPDGPQAFCGKRFGDTWRGLAAPYKGWKAA